MKRKIDYLRLGLSVILVMAMAMIPPCFPCLQMLSGDRSELVLGLPFHFYTVHYTSVGDFAAHWNVGSFLANVFVLYLVLALCAHIGNKLKTSKTECGGR